MFDSTRRYNRRVFAIIDFLLAGAPTKGRGPIKLQEPGYYLFFTASGEKTSPPPGGDVFSSEEEVCFRRVDI
jgi:hypothetical protein